MPSNLAATLNSEPVKYLVLTLSAPIWLPFVKALWRELNDALRDEGGLMGDTPTAAELDKRIRRDGAHVSPLVSETWEQHESGRGPAVSRRQGAPTRAPERPRGFRAR